MKFKLGTGSQNHKGILVSVVVPICNVAKYLTDCLDSICAQTLNNIEIICVDDCIRRESCQNLRNPH